MRLALLAAALNGAGTQTPPMLQSLKELFGALLPPAAAAARRLSSTRLQLATAVILIEVMRADTHFDAAERHAVSTRCAPSSRWPTTRSSG